jgi:hypothetical protein
VEEGKVMYHEDFESIEHMKKEFEITDADLLGVEILFAAYRTCCYDGTALVLFKKDDKFYIVNASHCSCSGLEDRWCPVETNEKALKMEIDAKSNYHYEEFESFIEFCRYYFMWEKK